METQQILRLYKNSLSFWGRVTGGQLKPIQGKTGIHPGHTNSPLKRGPTPRPNSCGFRPRTKETGVSDPSQNTNNSISKPGPCSCKESVSSARRYEAGSRHDTWARVHPRAQKHISFILDEFKKAESRGGHRMLPLGAVGNSIDSSDQCTEQHGQLFKCN